MSEKSEIVRRARALESLHNLADIRSRKIWGEVFARTGSIHDANFEATVEYASVMREVNKISENYIVRI